MKTISSKLTGIKRAFFATLILFTCITLKAQETVTDIDGNVYKTIKIGTQLWMAENLKTTRYRNADVIGTTTPDTLNISGESAPKYQWAYNGNESNVAVYGRLYTWYALTDNRNVCPTGWHVSTDAEWRAMTNFLGGVNIAGGKLKETGTSHWKNPNTGTTNESGFTALPAGSRYSTFMQIGEYGHYWTATEANQDKKCAWRWLLSSDNSLAHRGWSGKECGWPVRCVMDNPPVSTTGISSKSASTSTTSTDIKKGLVAYFPFNGNANDKSGNNNNGKITGATFVADKFGKPDKALFFDGMDNYIEIPSSPTINVTGSLSISCWIYPHSAENYTAWVAKANNNITCSQWRFGFGAPGPEFWGLTVWNSDWYDLNTNKKPIQLNTWSHVLLVADQEQHIAYLYLNGELIDTIKDIKEFEGSTDPLFIGRQKDDDNYFDGLIDEVRIYNRTLTTNEVKELFNQFNK